MEGLGAVLDRSWAVLVVMGRFRLNKVGHTPDLGQFLEPKRGPRWSQNATQEGPKSKTKTKMKKEGFEDRLGAVLGRSWLVLGVVLGSCLVVLYWFLYYFVRNDVFDKIRCQEATWADLGSIWAPKRLQNGGRGGSKSELS